MFKGSSWVSCNYDTNGETPYAQRTSIVGPYKHKLYLFGGGTSTTTVQNHFYSFDLISQKWEKIEPKNNQIPEPRWGHKCAIVQDKMILFGGHGKNAYLNDLWEYHFSENEWEKIEYSGDKPSIVSDHSLVATSDGFLFIYGGWNGSSRLVDSFYIYEMETKTFTKISDELLKENTSLRTLTVSAIWNDKLYVYSGEDGSYTYSDKMFEFDLQERSWKETEYQGSVTSRGVPAGDVFNGYWFIFGGSDRQNMLSDLICFDFESKEMISLQDSNTNKGRFAHNFMVYQNKLLYGFGVKNIGNFGDLNSLTLEYPLIREIIRYIEGGNLSKFYDYEIVCSDNETVRVNSSILKLRCKFDLLVEAAKNIGREIIENVVFYLYTGRYNPSSRSELEVVFFLSEELGILNLKLLAEGVEKVPESDNTILQDYEQLLQENESKDYELIHDEGSTLFHSWILAARSDDFKNILENKDKEKKKKNYSSIKIDGLTEQGANCLLTYLYTNKTEDLNIDIVEEIKDALQQLKLNQDVFEKVCSLMLKY
ncbi:hypothetical protein M0813_13576 [Anaeramoeba flamelloides]|nr:hypothetical protein M0813_13576 [Anaeramoeba flamelloides]|eukprot:Anaeramoba_flamelloidesa1054756_247.p1 GENE.a1054756_247~~a1054756_247.p1  ORF type:complete len:556 (-),score=104.80 a1054756_247:67-1680(-)